MCIIANQTSLGKAGCTPAQETAFCAAPAPIPPPPPLACTHTDSRGDSYDLSGVPKVDGLWKTIDNRPSYYHVGICSAPTQSATDPTVGCLPPCDPPCTGDMPCECKSKRAIDQGNEAVCQYDGKKSAVSDPDKAIVQYNLGLLKSGEQKWADGPTPGGSVTITYEGGSTRGGCGEENHRQTEILVECDPCKMHNITKVVEPAKCHYQLTVSSIAGCPTNKPLPAGTCPHICDKTTYQCKPAPPGAAGANATLADCSKTCKKVTPPPPPPLSKNPCVSFCRGQRACSAG